MNPKIKPIGKTDNFIDFTNIETNKRYCLNIEEVQKAYRQFKMWRMNNFGTTFACRLYNLMAQADIENIRKFLNGFPEHAIIYLLWYHSDSEGAFFKKWGKIFGE